jgi:uncharacterized OsmC-like protein
MRVRSSGPSQLELTQIASPELELQIDSLGAIELLAASLGVCTARVLETYAANVAQVPVDSLVVRVSWQLDEHPLRVGALELSIRWPELPQSRLEAARRAALTCTVHRTFAHPPTITTSVTRE